MEKQASMKNIFLKHWPIFIILSLSGLIVWPLFLPGYFSHHDDLQVMRIYEMRKCLEDLQIPCRWVPDMGYGNGFPLFNYYGVLPYYIGAILSFILGYIQAAKALFFIPLVLGGVSMYFLGKELFGKAGGLLAAMLYSFAPYRALDSYVRGAIDESFALALAPIVFYLILKVSQQKSGKNFLLLSLFFGAFLISHNIMTLFFVPVILIWTIYCIYREKSQNYLHLLLSLGIGLGLAAFFLLPAFVEKSLVQTDTLTRLDLDFRAHFVTIQQLFFNRNWGYGASIPGLKDTISFQIGWPYWWLVVLSLILAIGAFVLSKAKKNLLLIFLLFIIFVISIFMTHNRSAFIWEKIDILRFAQFPWRFLSLAIFSASLLGGSVVIFVKNMKIQYLAAALILTLTILLNWNFFRPEKFYFSMTDQEKLSGVQWEIQQKAAILDYLPMTAVEPKERAPDKPMVKDGEAQVIDFQSRSNSWSFKINVQKAANIEVPVFDFPNWQVYANGLNITHSHQNYLGRISVNLNPGTYKIVGRFNNTPIRTFSNLISLLSILSVGVILIYGKNKNFFV